MNRIAEKFKQIKKEGRAALITYICGGDPNINISLDILQNLSSAGSDIIELGVPFLDPSGDGPIIENASKRSIANGANLKKILEMVSEFRKKDSQTPLILMGYYNPFLKYGVQKVFSDMKKSGVDGVLIVDLPLEEKKEIMNYIKKSNIDFINLISPTSDESRIKKIAKDSKGFLYLISMNGITGTKLANPKDNIDNLTKIRNISKLPVAIGFGIKNPNQAKEFANIGFDAVVIGSEIVKEIDKNFTNGKNQELIVLESLKKVKEFSKAIKD